MPGLVRPTPTTRSGDQRWIGSRHALNSAKTATISVAQFTKGTHYPKGYLPSGLAVNAADPSTVKPFTGAAGEVLRFLKDNHQVEDGVTLINVALIWHGLVYTQYLPIALPGATTASGSAAGFVFDGSAV